MENRRGLKNIYKPSLLNAVKYRGGKANPAPGKVHKLSSNENPLGPSPAAIRAIEDSLAQLNSYPDNDDQRLREALHNHYQGHLQPDNFITAPSGSELIELILRGFTNPGEEIIICSPTFMPYQIFAEKLGVIANDVRRKEQTFDVDVQGVLQEVNTNTRLIFLDSPSNPSGQIIRKHELRRLVNELPDQVIVILDEVYHHYVNDLKYTTAAPLVLDGKRIIGLNSFSKAYGLAGLRLGYAYATEQIASYLRLLCKPFFLSTLQLEAGIAALSDHDFVGQTKALVSKEKNFLYRELQELDIKHWPSQANFVLIKSPSHIDNLEQKMLAKGVMIRPVLDKRLKNYFRVSIGKHEAMQTFTVAFRELLSEHAYSSDGAAVGDRISDI